MSVFSEKFGTLPDGREATLFTLTNQSGMKVKITNVAAAIVSILVPDSHGKLDDVVLGYDHAKDYLSKGPYHGAVVGRVANRIEDAVFTLNGKLYKLSVNHKGKHMLHGGEIGLDSKLYDAKIQPDNTLALHTVLPDGEDGFPGNISLTVIYQLSEDNGLSIHYLATTDADTPINLTNHSYFNLRGHDAGSILDHQLQIFSREYTPLDKNGMVCGVVAPTKGTMDFSAMKPIGRDIDADCEQLKIAGGYDHNYILPTFRKALVLAAWAEEETSGRFMQVYTNSPAVLLYTGNYLEESPIPGKGGVEYHARGGFCLETNFYPNALKYPQFPQPVLRAGETYDYTTIFRFGAHAK